MTFNLDFSTHGSGEKLLQLKAGEMLFVLGANGTGKSSLMFHFGNKNWSKTRKLSAHRQTWMDTDTFDLNPALKLQAQQTIQVIDQEQESRYRDKLAAQRTNMTLYDLIDAENIRAREIMASVDDGELSAADEFSKKKNSPITVTNELLLR